MFTPESGTIELEDCENSGVFSIRVRCVEKMDPDDPQDNDDRILIQVDGIPFAGNSHRDLQFFELSNSQLIENGFIEASIYHYGYHNPVNIESLRFGKLGDNHVLATLIGVVDFTYEGLARLGKPRLQLSVPLHCDFVRFDSMFPNA